MDIHRCRFVDYTPSPITAVDFSHPADPTKHAPPNLRLAVGRSNGNIEIWNPRHGWCMEAIMYGAKSRSIEGLAWALTDNTPRLFSIGFSTMITEWNLNTTKPLVHEASNAGAAWSLAINNEKQLLAVGCDDGSCVLFDISGGPGVIEYVRTLTRQTSRILSLAWKDNLLVGGCADGIVKVWDTNQANGPIVARMRVDKVKKGEPALVWSVKCLRDGTIVTGDSLGTVKFWNGKYFNLEQSFKLHAADVLCLGVSYDGNIVFSSGIDRKTIQYVRDVHSHEWTSGSYRRFHAHDVRCMAVYESKSLDLLVSGGMDMSLGLIPLRHFTQKNHRMIPAVPQIPRMAIASKARLFMLWEDHQVRLWRVGSPGYRSLLKLVIQNEENIVHACISVDGQYVAISTILETKLFKLIYGENEVTVERVYDEFLSSVGALLLQFTMDTKKLILVTPESDTFIIDLSRVDSHQLEVFEVSQTEPVNTPMKQKLNQNPSPNFVCGIAVSPDGDWFAITNLHGHTYCYSLSNLTHTELPRMSSPIRTMAFRPDVAGRLVAVTASNQVYEFDVQSRKLTEWSRHNSNIMPKAFAQLQDKAFGSFFDASKPSRFWVWSANWLAFFDLEEQLPALTSEKRKADSGAEGKPGQHRRRPSGSQNLPTPMLNNHATNSRAFWITFKYRPMLSVGTISENELLVVERPVADMLMDKDLPPKFYENKFTE